MLTVLPEHAGAIRDALVPGIELHSQSTIAQRRQPSRAQESWQQEHRCAGRQSWFKPNHETAFLQAFKRAKCFWVSLLSSRQSEAGYSSGFSSCHRSAVWTGWVLNSLVLCETAEKIFLWINQAARGTWGRICLCCFWNVKGKRRRHCA